MFDILDILDNFTFKTLIRLPDDFMGLRKDLEILPE
jgi:hypothetical protein